MSLRDDLLTITDVAELVCIGGSSGNPKTIVIGTPSGDIWIGGPTVDDTEGYPLSSESPPLTLLLGPGDDLWMVSGGSETVNVLISQSDIRSGAGDDA